MAQKSHQGSVGAGATEGVPGTTGVAPVAACEARPDPKLVERPQRGKFSAEYKLRMLELADQCTEPGSLGRLLRKEGSYWSRLSNWRRQREEAILRALGPARRGLKRGGRIVQETKLELPADLSHSH